MAESLQKQAEALVRMQFGDEAAALFTSLQEEKPEQADAIILLQGDRLDRVAKTAELFLRGFAPRVFLAGNNKLIGVGPRPGENDIALEEIRKALIGAGVPDGAITVDDKALNTKEQAVRSMRAAIQEGWKKILVVTSPYHLLRAHLTFIQEKQEQGWEGETIFQGADFAWDTVPAGRSSTALEMLVLETEKIRKYGFDFLLYSDKERGDKA
ncbi:MAG: YdcF family protein [Patescibacteria group bacterium]